MAEGKLEEIGQPRGGDGSGEDFWGEDEYGLSTSLDSLVLEREWDVRRQQFHNIGYRDGIIAGKDSSLQEGFNCGFKEAGVAGMKWGMARSLTSAFAALPSAARERMIQDPIARDHLEQLHASISKISSTEAMRSYYKDSILKTTGLEARTVSESSPFANQDNLTGFKLVDFAEKICAPEESCVSSNRSASGHPSTSQDDSTRQMCETASVSLRSSLPYCSAMGVTGEAEYSASSSNLLSTSCKPEDGLCCHKRQISPVVEETSGLGSRSQAERRNVAESCVAGAGAALENQLSLGHTAALDSLTRLDQIQERVNAEFALSPMSHLLLSL